MEKPKSLDNASGGSCGPFSVCQFFLILRGMHPRDAEEVFGRGNRESLRDLQLLCRSVTVDTLGDGVFVNPSETGGAMSNATVWRELSTREAWIRGILTEDEWYDERAMMLLAKALGIEKELCLVRWMSFGNLQPALTNCNAGPVPSRSKALILYRSGNHFEVIVPEVSVLFPYEIFECSFR